MKEKKKKAGITGYEKKEGREAIFVGRLNIFNSFILCPYFYFS